VKDKVTAAVTGDDIHTYIYKLSSIYIPTIVPDIEV
jgi:hypothetical protein